MFTYWKVATFVLLGGTCAWVNAPRCAALFGGGAEGAPPPAVEGLPKLEDDETNASLGSEVPPPIPDGEVAQPVVSSSSNRESPSPALDAGMEAKIRDLEASLAIAARRRMSLFREAMPAPTVPTPESSIRIESPESKPAMVEAPPRMPPLKDRLPSGLRVLAILRVGEIVIARVGDANLRVGEFLPGTEIRVAGIAEREVIFENGGERASLHMDSSESQAAPQAEPAPKPPVEKPSTPSEEGAGS